MMEEIGRRIVNFCAENSITKTQLAEILGVGNQAVYSWVAGRRKMDPKIYKKFCSLEKHSGFLDPEHEAYLDDACNRLSYFNRETYTVEAWTAKLQALVKTSRKDYLLEGSNIDENLLEEITSFIPSFFNNKATLQVINKLSSKLNEKLEQDSLTDEELVNHFQRKWSDTPLNLSFMKKESVLIVKYSVPFIKKEASKLKEKLIKEGANLIKIKDIEEKEIVKMLSKQSSFEVCFFPSNTFNTSGGPKLRNGVFEDSWALSMVHTKKWRDLLRTIDRRIALQKKIEASHIIDTVMTLDFLMKSKDVDSIYSIAPPEELKSLFKKNHKTKSLAKSTITT